MKVDGNLDESFNALLEYSSTLVSRCSLKVLCLTNTNQTKTTVSSWTDVLSCAKARQSRGDLRIDKSQQDSNNAPECNAAADLLLQEIVQGVQEV